MAVKAKATISLVRVDDGETGKGVSKTEVYYYLSTSNTTQTGGSWVTTPPAWIDGRYYWQKIKTTFTDSTTSESKPVCITGGKGSSGSDGKSVSSITTQFYLSTSKTTQTGGSWVDTMPTWSVGKYLWTRSKIVYINPSSTVYTAPVCDSSWDAINDIEIGGRNYAPNMLGKGSDAANGLTIDFLDNAFRIHGTVTGTEAAFGIGGVWISSENFFKPGETYTVSTTPALPAGVYIGINTRSSETGSQTSAGNYLWGPKKSETFTIDDESDGYINGFFGISPNLLPEDKSIDITFRLKLEKGNVATDWSPAPESITIGGRNFIQNSDQFLEEESDGTGPINASQTDMPVSALNFYNTKGTQCTISVDVTLENAVSTVTNSGHRVGTEITLKRGDGSINQYVRAWITLREAPISTSQRLSITYDLYDDYLESYKPVCGIYIQGLTGGKVRVGKPKLEIGNKATDWTPAPEDTQSAIDDALDQATSEITTQYTSLINETAKQLELMVTQLKTITDGHTTSISSISNQLQITSEMAQFVKTTTEKLQDAVDGKLSATEVQEWARFDGANLELGASNSPFKCKLSTTELAFYQGANKVAWISNNELNILTAIIAKSIGCGNFTFVDEGELGFSLI